jgi:hypothetical protein
VKLPYTFRNVSRPLTEADIEGFETNLGIRLPDGYRSFLREVNGGYPQNEGFSYGDGRSFMLQRLYPLTNEIESYFNLHSLNHADCDAPSGFLVIGTSSFGDPVCLGVAPPNENKVVYLDHEERDPDKVDDDPMLGVYLLSDSFEEFILSLEDEWAKLK